MSACCVSGCKNRHSSSSKLKFYRIPSKCRPFQANRRRLWQRAIQQVNGSAAELKGNARICGAHFISGEASMDHDSPDFVPSVFACTEQSQNLKKRAKWFYGSRKRRRRKANVKEEEETTPSRVESPVDVQSSVLMEETQTLSSLSVPKEGETLTKEAETETETKTIESSSPNKANTSFKVPADIPTLWEKIPTVSLKSVFLPARGYQCEVCSQIFTGASQLIKHKQLHEDGNKLIGEDGGKLFTTQADFTEHQRVHEPSFPCNMCERSFTTRHNLKRHKLLHVKDGRKCRKCGILFCRLHNHVVFLPQSGTESEQESSVAESPLEKPEPNQSSDLDDGAQGTTTVAEMQTTPAQAASPASPKPSPWIHNPLPPASHRRIIKKIPVPMLKRPSLKLPAPRSSRDDCPANVVQPQPRQHPELPPSLKIFSPQCLTSALLEVERNYEYILSKTRDGKNDLDIVKKEPCELPVIHPAEQSTDADETKGRIAYDLEIVL